MRREHRYSVYIMQSSSRRALYIGMTSALKERVFKHKEGVFDGFTKKYGVSRLVYFESFDDVRNAIDREKQLKGWRRAKKIALIERVHPQWKDLSAEWYRELSK